MKKWLIGIISLTALFSFVSAQEVKTPQQADPAQQKTEQAPQQKNEKCDDKAAADGKCPIKDTAKKEEDKKTEPEKGPVFEKVNPGKKGTVNTPVTPSSNAADSAYESLKAGEEQPAPSTPPVKQPDLPEGNDAMELPGAAVGPGTAGTEAVIEAEMVTKKAPGKKQAEPQAPVKERSEAKQAVSFQPYGFIELDGWANDRQFMSNDLPMYCLDNPGSSVGMSAKSTRLGLKVTFPSIENIIRMAGVVEVDFVGNMTGSGAAEAQPMIRLRHAYMDIAKTWGNSTFGGKAGQTWATGIVLVFPYLINQGAGWGFGNVWQRLPLGELYFTQKFGGLYLGVQAGIARAMSGASANSNSLIEVNVDAGDATKMPQFHGQLSLKGDVSIFNILLAAGGLWGRENYERGLTARGVKYTGKQVDVWLFNTGLKLTHQYANISGKFYIGDNLDLFGVMGGSLRGVPSDWNPEGTAYSSFNVTGSQRAMGGFGQVGVTPFDGFLLATGGGIESIDHDQSQSYPKYFSNTSWWVYAEYTFLGHFTVGLQWLQLHTNDLLIKFDPASTGSPYIRKSLTGNSIMGMLRLSF